MNGIDDLVRYALQILQSTRDLAAEMVTAADKGTVTMQAAAEQMSTQDACQEIVLGIRESLASLKSKRDRADIMVGEMSATLEGLSHHVRELSAELEGLQARSQIGERVIRAQEEERRRVAREIHDGPAQALANVVLRAEICERLLAAGRSEVTQELTQMKLLVKESLKEVRKIIFNLRPMTLDDLGLIPTLHRYFENLKEYDGTPVHLHVAGYEQRLHPAEEVAVFRTIQEAVNNARRHAQASHIGVSLVFEPDTLTVTIEDDGTGFDIRQVEREWASRESFGLMGMRERVELIRGEYELESVPGQGTSIRVRLRLGEHPPGAHRQDEGRRSGV